MDFNLLEYTFFPITNMSILLLSVFFYVKFFVVDFLLPSKIWTVILTFLLPLDLLGMSCCSERFYIQVHPNQKYREKLEHSRRLLNSLRMDRIISPFATILFCNRDEYNPKCLCSRPVLCRCDKVFSVIRNSLIHYTGDRVFTFSEKYLTLGQFRSLLLFLVGKNSYFIRNS